jgi:hypothetical protein
MALPMMILAQESQPATETVIVEGVGKTEASAKKAAYKEAVAKVVGVLIDSSTLVKNDKIISEELLEYSGGFVKNAEVLSTKTDDEGLVRVKVKCLIEKAQVKRKLEDMKVLVVKVDGASLAAREMTQEDMRKNAATLVNKALEERKKIYEVKMPKKLEELEKQDNSCVYLPVSVEFNEAKFKAWVDNWVPVFDKMAIDKKSGVTNYKISGRTYSTGGSGYEATEDKFLQEFIEASKIPSSQTFYLLVAANTFKTGPVQYHAYKIPCGIRQIKCLSQNYTDPKSNQNLSIKPDILFTSATIRSKSNDLMYSGTCAKYSIIKGPNEYVKNPKQRRNGSSWFDNFSIADQILYNVGIPKNPITEEVADLNINAHPKCALIIIPPFPGHACNSLERIDQETQFFQVGNFGCFFEIDLSKLRLEDIDKVETSIQWNKYTGLKGSGRKAE